MSPAAPTLASAWPRLRSFARRHGKPQVLVAMHAAVPLGLTPELLNLIRVNFVDRAHFITEADLLLSDLIRDLGGGYYELGSGIRDGLLEQLRDTFGPERIRRVADFLYSYCDVKLRGRPGADGRQFLRAQQWAALSYLAPEKTAEHLARALEEGLERGDGGEIRRVVGVSRALAEPLAGAGGVVRYGVALVRALDGEVEEAARAMEPLGDSDEAHRVGTVELPAPAQLAETVRGIGRSEWETAAEASVATDTSEGAEEEPQPEPVTGRRFRNDVWISYARIDDQPLEEGDNGWITRFEKSLRGELLNQMGEEVNVFFDHSLAERESTGSQMAEALADTAVMVAMVSPAYLRSEWTSKEVDVFSEVAAATGGLLIGDRSRLLKVMLQPVPIEEQPPPLQGTLGYDFYREDPDSGSPLGIDIESEEFRLKTRALARDIRNMLRSLKVPEADADAEPEEDVGQKTVHVIYEQQDEEAVRPVVAQLSAEGFEVTLPIFHGSPEEVQRSYVEGLTMCDGVLIYHGQGSDYWLRSKLRDLEKAKAQGRWTEKEAQAIVLGPPETRQKQGWKDVHAVPVESEQETMVLRAWDSLSPETLRPFVEQLRGAPLPDPETSEAVENAGTVFVDVHTDDVQRVSELVGHLTEIGRKPILLPAETSSPEEGMYLFERNLEQAEVFIVVFGGVSRDWVEHRLQEAFKLVVSKNLSTRLGVYVAPPEKSHDDLAFPPHFEVALNMDSFDPATLVPLLEGRPDAESTPDDGKEPQDEPLEMPEGAVFISYAREDRQAVLVLKDGLDRVGVDTWGDEDDLSPPPLATPGSARIFLSYRREDTAFATEAIYKGLTERFGPEAVFRDVDDIPLGVKWREHIARTVEGCAVFVAVIGKDWHGPLEDGSSRIEDEADFIRIETETALKRKIPLIPVLVDGAAMPGAEKLPDGLEDLAFINGLEVRGSRDLDRDIKRLYKAVDRHLADRPSSKSSLPLAGADINEGILRAIERCLVFVPVISPNSLASELVREEWLEAERMLETRPPEIPFVVPVTIDDPRSEEWPVPEAFRRLDWTHLPHGKPDQAFLKMVRDLVREHHKRQSSAS